MIRITAEIAATKFFLRELLLFFIEKRGAVFGDGDFTFSIAEFSDFIRGKEFARVMGDDITFQKVREHLECCRIIKKRDHELKISTPPSPLLNYTAQTRRSEFTIKDCQTEYLKNALRDINLALHINDWQETSGGRERGNAKTLFKETQGHALTFLEKTLEGTMSNKERAIFETLANAFGQNCSYINLFDKYRRLERVNGTAVERQTAREKKESVNGGIQELRKKLYEISGNPNTIETLPGRTSMYRLVY